MNRLDEHDAVQSESEEERESLHEFQHTYRSFADRVERLLMQLVILGLVALALVQSLHTSSTIRRMISLVDGLEGLPLNQESAWSGEQAQAKPVATTQERIMLTVVSMTRRSVPEATLLVDGKAVGNFTAGSVTAPVRPGQTVTVDGTGSLQALDFRVVGPPGLANPALGTTVTTRGSIRSFGAVQPAR